MKFKLLVITVMLQGVLLLAQEEEYKPAKVFDEDIEVDGNTILPEQDNLAGFKRAIQKLENTLDAAPEGEAGKKHPDYARVVLIAQKMKTWLATESFSDFCEVFHPVEALYVSPSWQSLDENCRDALFSMLNDFTKEPSVQITKHVKNNINNIDDKMLEKFVSVYVTSPLRMGDSDWEFVDADTIDAAGIFIIDPEKVSTILRTKNASQLRTFLKGNYDNDFFKRYKEAGDGLRTIKEKYSANEANVNAKLAEVVAHAASLGDVKDEE